MWTAYFAGLGLANSKRTALPFDDLMSQQDKMNTGAANPLEKRFWF
jgi:hypothetical protein